MPLGDAKAKPDLGLRKLFQGDHRGGHWHHHLKCTEVKKRKLHDIFHHPFRGASFLVDIVQGGARHGGGHESRQDEHVHLLAQSLNLCNQRDL